MREHLRGACLLAGIAASLPGAAGAESVLELSVAASEAEGDQQIEVPLRVRWEPKTRPPKLDYSKCTLSIEEEGQAAEGIIVRLERSRSATEDLLRLTYRSAHPKGPRIALLEMDCGGAHNGVGNRVALFSPKPNAHIVISGGGKDLAAARKAARIYADKGLPRHDEFPKLAESRFISGLKPGFHIVVATIAEDKSVAQALIRFIQRAGGEAYMRRVWVESPESVGAVVAFLKLTDDTGAPFRPKEAFLRLNRKKGASRKLRAVRGRSTVARTNEVLFLFTLEKGLDSKGSIGFEVHEDMDCPSLEVSGLRPGMVEVTHESAKCFMVGD